MKTKAVHKVHIDFRFLLPLGKRRVVAAGQQRRIVEARLAVESNGGLTCESVLLPGGTNHSATLQIRGVVARVTETRVC